MPSVGGDATVLVVEVAGMRVAFPAEVIREVLRMPAFSPLPGAPSPVAGVLDLRGTAVAVLDLRRLLSLRAADPALDQRLVLVELTTGPALLWVDEVHGLQMVAGAITSLADVHDVAPSVAGVVRTEEGLLVVHDADAFLSRDETVALERALVVRAGGNV